jgi:MOSC domain-containing protein YiiM
MGGTVVHLQLAGRQGRRAVDSAIALTDCGLEGDRNARPGRRRQILLVERAVLDEFQLPPGALSEQTTVDGVALSAIAPGTRLRAGSVLLEVSGPCEPCHKMNRHGPGMQELLRGKRGLLARVLEGGEVRVGDELCACT